MMKVEGSTLYIIFHVLLCIMVSVKSSGDNERKPYIVYMGEHVHTDGGKIRDGHHNTLSDVIGDEALAKELRIHSYEKSLNGFVAHLFPHEATKLKERDDIISVFPNKANKIMTSRSWDFVGLPETVKRIPEVESNVIVGVIDTGIYADIPSFAGENFGPPPSKWKGKCDKGANFTGCNNKLIGAQYFNLNGSKNAEDNSPTDVIGHGTHVASIVAGNVVPGTSFYGLLEGRVRGAVPAARIASYKACPGFHCDDMNLLAAFDAAIADGVDIISISAGTNDSSHLFNDAVSIGSFHALKKGISTVTCAGNNGPFFYSMVNFAPWVTVVAASTTDKAVQTSFKLGNGKVYTGYSVNSIPQPMTPLTSGALAKDPNDKSGGDASKCQLGTVSNEKAKGQILHCHGVDTMMGTIRDFDIAGFISSTDQVHNGAMPGFVPSVMVNRSIGDEIDQYITSTKSPTASIDKSVIADEPAPAISYLSSRGPQILSPNILRPDLAAPGVNILAGWTALRSVTWNPRDKRYVKYYITSGTSMATPHAAGATAYVKIFHPDWSPSAIKSALMTTAKPMKVEPAGGAIATGAGMIDPVAALNPGLVYDNNVDAYISYLCKQGFNSSTIAIITGNNVADCSKMTPSKGTDGLNYPTMHLHLEKQGTTDFSAVFYRTVTNVGGPGSLYKANVESPKEMSVTVVPKALSFTKQNQTLSFRVDVKGKFVDEESYFFQASLIWSDQSNHHVKSPIIVFRNTTQSWFNHGMVPYDM